MSVAVYNPRMFEPLQGTLGDAASQAKIAQVATTAVSGVGATLTPLIAHSIFAGAAGAAMPAFAIPVVGAAIFGVTLALSAILNRKGPAQKEAATAAVNKVDDLLRQNLAAYMAGPRDRNAQTMALVNFDQSWSWLLSADGCGNPALGSAGQRCISERQRGGTAPWCPTGTGCDYFVTMRDPIANDTRPAELEQAAAATAAPDSAVLSFLPSGSVAGLPLPLLLGLGLFGVAMFAEARG